MRPAPPVAIAAAVLPADAGLTVTGYPPALNRPDADVTVTWQEQVDGRLNYGRLPGVYTGATVSHGVGSLTFRARTKSAPSP